MIRDLATNKALLKKFGFEEDGNFMVIRKEFKPNNYKSTVIRLSVDVDGKRCFIGNNTGVREAMEVAVRYPDTLGSIIDLWELISFGTFII